MTPPHLTHPTLIAVVVLAAAPSALGCAEPGGEMLEACQCAASAMQGFDVNPFSSGDANVDEQFDFLGRARAGEDHGGGECCAVPSGDPAQRKCGRDEARAGAPGHWRSFLQNAQRQARATGFEPRVCAGVRGDGGGTWTTHIDPASGVLDLPSGPGTQPASNGNAHLMYDLLHDSWPTYKAGIRSSPALSPDAATVYVGGAGHFFAVNAASFTRKWTFTPAADGPHAGAWFDSSPAVGRRGRTVYAGSRAPAGKRWDGVQGAWVTTPDGPAGAGAGANASHAGALFAFRAGRDLEAVPFGALGFVVQPGTGRCFCEREPSATCTRAGSSGYTRHDFFVGTSGTPSIPANRSLPAWTDAVFADGECADDPDLRMFDGNGDNEGTAAERTARCAWACLDKQKPLREISNTCADGFAREGAGMCLATVGYCSPASCENLGAVAPCQARCEAAGQVDTGGGAKQSVWTPPPPRTIRDGVEAVNGILGSQACGG